MTRPRIILLGLLLGVAVAGAWAVHPLAGLGAGLGAIGVTAWLLMLTAAHARVAVSRDTYRRELEKALGATTDEDSAAALAGIALASASPGAFGEVFLTSRDQRLLHRMASSPTGPAGCPVTEVSDCLALRYGAIQAVTSSDSLGACPKLRNRLETTCSAVCAPVGFAGVPLGVLHVIGPEGPVSQETVERLALAGDRLGTRIGTLRIVAATSPGASLDTLTGLLDRNGLEERLRVLARSGQLFSLAIADVDHLSDINEALGTDEGDSVLRVFARVLRTTVRGNDVVARFGGEEFALVFPETDADEAAKLLERIQFALGGVHAAGESAQFTVSFGVADTTSSHGVEGAINDAEAALLQAKANGRNRIVVARR